MRDEPTVQIPEGMIINGYFRASWWTKYWRAMLWIRQNPLAKAMNTKVRYHFKKANQRKQAPSRVVHVLDLSGGPNWERR